MVVVPTYLAPAIAHSRRGQRRSRCPCLQAAMQTVACPLVRVSASSAGFFPTDLRALWLRQDLPCTFSSIIRPLFVRFVAARIAVPPAIFFARYTFMRQSFSLHGPAL